jgi:hypothetical protein
VAESSSEEGTQGGRWGRARQRARRSSARRGGEHGRVTQYGIWWHRWPVLREKVKLEGMRTTCEGLIRAVYQDVCVISGEDTMRTQQEACVAERDFNPC